MSNSKSKAKISNLVLPTVLLVFFFYFLIKSVFSSVFIKDLDRVNVLFYSKNTSYFSFSKNDVNYLVSFSPETEVLVPGGYGYYRIGSLGKLVELEKKPDLLKKVFSATTSSFVDLYFYPRSTEIYYGGSATDFFPSMTEILFAKSNANMIDRLFILVKLFDQNQSNYKIISLNDSSLSQQQFTADFQGSFYKKSYRNKQVNVQILYKQSYSTASLLSSMIDGEGIRVVDMSQSDENLPHCQIVTESPDFISKAMADFFGCSVKTGKTTISDIILKLGNLEKDWAAH
ncbi:hypothetical protein M1328_01520 [Patescibacteria group bacterium]|nr:hypothetical protein [Patescibacteria group bacterium]